MFSAMILVGCCKVSSTHVCVGGFSSFDSSCANSARCLREWVRVLLGWDLGIHSFLGWCQQIKWFTIGPHISIGSQFFNVAISSIGSECPERETQTCNFMYRVRYTDAWCNAMYMRKIWVRTLPIPVGIYVMWHDSTFARDCDYMFASMCLTHTCT